MADGEPKTDETWRAPHHRSAAPERARQLKLAHPDWTTAEIAGHAGLSHRAAWAAIRILRDKQKRQSRYSPRTGASHPSIEFISAVERAYTAEERHVAATPSHPEHHHRQLPQTRADCPTERPCMFLSCRHHMATDHHKHGVNVFDLPLEVVSTCSLDVAGQGAKSLEEVSMMMGVTRARVQQIEAKALLKIRRHGGAALLALSEHHADPAEHRVGCEETELSRSPGGRTAIKKVLT